MLRAKFINIENLAFSTDFSDNDIIKNIKRSVSIELYISPVNDIDNNICYFVVNTINEITHEGKRLLIFRSRSVFRLLGFYESPNKEILVELVFNAYYKHIEHYSDLIKEYEFLEKQDVPELILSNFEENLDGILLNLFPLGFHI